MTDVIETLLQQSEGESRSLGHDYIGSVHLLLGIIHLAGESMVNVLREHSVEPERLRITIQVLLQ